MLVIRWAAATGWVIVSFNNGECHRELKECHREPKVCHRDLKECHRDLKECHRDLKECHRELSLCRKMMCVAGKRWDEIEGLVQECSNSRKLAMELLQSCAKPTKDAVKQHPAFTRHNVDIRLRQHFSWEFNHFEIILLIEHSNQECTSTNLIAQPYTAPFPMCYCYISSALAMEIQQSWAKPLK